MDPIEVSYCCCCFPLLPLFIPPEQSPDGAPLLVLTHETTDSLALLRIDPVFGAAP